MTKFIKRAKEVKKISEIPTEALTMRCAPIFGQDLLPCAEAWRPILAARPPPARVAALCKMP
jgi:hypothetical protein